MKIDVTIPPTSEEQAARREMPRIEISLTPENAEERDRAVRLGMRSRWEIFRDGNEWGVRHVVAGEFGRPDREGTWHPFRWETFDEAEAWIEEGIDETLREPPLTLKGLSSSPES